MKIAILLVVAGCADNSDPCAHDEVPADLYEQQFDQQTLTCTEIHYITDCLDPEMCICSPKFTTAPTQCTGGCFSKTEDQCMADSTCFATRTAGSLAFIACYDNQAKTDSDLAPCDQRSDAYRCEEFSETSPACQPLYTQGQYVSCTDPL
ncbi:MAG: hypothetical protein QM831_14480 [Kofleriaceae bacterium]